jgi:glycosyltransferase involved in cell wall biosynthesis
VVYVGISGGWGQVYDLFFIAISRFFKLNIYLHHHSYQYINKPKMVNKLLFTLAGKNSNHIVACSKMEVDLKLKYQMISNIRVISGICAIEPWIGHIISREKIKTIGFLSNISKEKGIFIFLKIAQYFLQKNIAIKFLLGGPFQDEHIRFEIEKHLSCLSNVHYVGSKYGDEKKNFFDSIDLFLFPTLYSNESEGLVIHEAMSRAVPVISFARGCIEHIVTNDVGLAIQPGDDFFHTAVSKVEEWLSRPDVFHAKSRMALSEFVLRKNYYDARMNIFCNEINSRVIS